MRVQEHETVIRKLILAVGFVLVGATDWQLEVPGQPPICAKSERVCREAQAAIASGRWPIAPSVVHTVCAPAPGCFTPESDHIPGFN